MKRPDYNKNNYCVICELVYPKDVTRCTMCKKNLRKSSKKKASNTYTNTYKNMSQSDAIKEKLNYYLDRGMTDKTSIFTRVVDDLGVPRPSVRRIAGELRTEFRRRIQILQSDFTGLGMNQQ